MKTKKMGTYKKMGLILLAGAAGGGLVGALLGAGMELYGSGLASGAGNVLSAGTVRIRACFRRGKCAECTAAGYAATDDRNRRSRDPGR